MNLTEILPRNEQSESLDNLYDALEAAEEEFLPILKKSFNPHFKSDYADLGEVLDAIKPALKKHKLRLQKFTYSEDNRAGTILRLIHRPSKEYIQTATIPVVDKLTPQGFGSTWTYTRRYSISNLLNLVTEDDDAETASGRGKEETKPPIRKAEKVKSKPSSESTPRAFPADSSHANSKYVAKDTDVPTVIGSTPSESGTSQHFIFNSDGQMMEPWKSRGTKLVKSLEEAGLTKDPGKKLLAYLLQDAGISDKLKLTAYAFDATAKELEVLLGTAAGKESAIKLVEYKTKEKSA